MHKQTTKQLYEAWAPRMSSCSGASALSFGIFNRTMRTNQLPQLLFKTALIIEGNTKHALYFEGAAASERSISHIVGYCGLIVFTLKLIMFITAHSLLECRSDDSVTEWLCWSKVVS